MFGLKSSTNRKSRNQARRKQQAQGFSWRWSSRYIWPAIAGIGALLLVMLMPRGEFLPTQKIRISGQFSELDKAEVQQQLRPHLGKGFFAVNIERIQAEVLSQPWVSSVSIHRVWPNELSVRIVEKKAYARWDDDHLLSRAGDVFAADTSGFASLPLIQGYAGQSKAVLQRFRQTRQRLAGHGLGIVEYREDSKGALTLKLDSGLAVSLGSDELQRKMDQLMAVYDLHIRNRTAFIEHIDFRYSNGFAVAWKPEYLNQRGEMLQRGENNV